MSSVVQQFNPFKAVKIIESSKYVKCRHDPVAMRSCNVSVDQKNINEPLTVVDKARTIFRHTISGPTT